MDQPNTAVLVLLLVLAVIGTVTWLVTAIALYISTFRQGLAWGLGALFLYPLVYVVVGRRWEENQRVFLLHISGLGVMLLVYAASQLLGVLPDRDRRPVVEQPPSIELPAAAPSLELPTASSVPVPADGLRSPLRTHSLDDLRLVGIALGETTRNAMLKTPDGEGHPIHVGSLVGTRHGIVTEIQSTYIVVKEQYAGPSGKIETTQTRMDLNR